MKERPILFSTPMVQALLDGRKTQTRRIITMPDAVRIEADKITFDDIFGWEVWQGTKALYGLGWCKYGEPGDLFWVREMHYRYGKWVKNGFTITGKQAYRFVPDRHFKEVRYIDTPPAEISTARGGTGWYKRPSIHMPKEAARIWLRLKSVRAEQVQEISEGDAIAEGIEPVQSRYKYYLPNGPTTCASPINSYMSLWKSINGFESWALDPWVWALEFEVLSTTGKPQL